MENMEYLTIKEAAKVAEVCEKTIRNWITVGNIKAEYSTGLRRWRVIKQSLLSYIEYK
jgi:excisionase family DNA binding protein